MLKTERLLIRPIVLSDAETVEELASDKRIADTTFNIPHPYPKGRAIEWINTFTKNTYGKNFAITLNNKLIGCISIIQPGQEVYKFKAEVGYWVGFDYWNQGYCTEALKAIIEYAFQEMQLHKIVARHMAINPASGAVMKKAGMIKEGYLIQDAFKNGKFVDMELYGIVKE